MKVLIQENLIFRPRGISLVVALLMTLVILILSMSLANLALQNEKASRTDRDRQVAFMAAEAALKDAEMDIDSQVVLPGSRSHLFDPASQLYFETGCAKGDGNIYQGMCLPSPPGQIPVWLSIDLADDSDDASLVKLGRFTGQTMAVGKGIFPAKLPKYLIEVVQDVEAGQSADERTKYIFRITAIGFGSDSKTQVVLQTYYRKAPKST
ncbi:pilus assembly PilX family protein [Undibacterium sp. Dicai25W]|uniref:pilus assembly PilX family protein n=1 Tax=Undibacterium sp. Dicai25W TaxID=3413034 RepID=UPI003BF186F2